MERIQALPTTYSGCRFRSRAEARWAVFFDHLDLKWEYEPEGYALDSGPYLPDFFLRDLDSFYEVKGTTPTVEEDAKASDLCHVTKKRVYLAVGSPRPPGVPRRGRLFDDAFALYTPPNDLSVFFLCDDGMPGWDTDHRWCECAVCGLVGIQFQGFADQLPCEHYDGGREINDASTRLRGAYDAARAARFGT